MSGRFYTPTLSFYPYRGYTQIPNRALEEHICEAWRAGIRWDQWRMVSHVIAGAHDLYYAAGLVARAPLLRDLEFLRQLAETRHKMHRQELTVGIEELARNAERMMGRAS